MTGLPAAAAKLSHSFSCLIRLSIGSSELCVENRHMSFVEMSVDKMLA